MRIEELPSTSSHEMGSSTSASRSCPPLQGRDVIPRPTLHLFPDVISRLIAEFLKPKEREDGYRFASATVRLLKGQTLGLFERDLLLLCPDEALRDALWEVQGDVSKLDPESRTRLTEIAPFVQHLNLSGLHIMAQTIRALVTALALPGDSKTTIVAITLSETEIRNETLQELGKLKTEGRLSNLKRLKIDQKGAYIGCACCAKGRPIDEVGMRALATSGLLQGLEHLTLKIRHFFNAPAIFPTSLLAGCVTLRTLRDLYCVTREDIAALQNQGTLGHLQELALSSFSSREESDEELRLLVDSSMQLRHFELNQNYLWPETIRAWLQSGLLKRLFQKCDTISFRFTCLRDTNIHLLAELAAANIPLNKITHLQIDASTFSNELIGDIALYMPRLQSLSFTDCTLVSYNPHLFRNFVELRDLSITKCRFSGEDKRWRLPSPKAVLWLQSIVQALPGLQKLAIGLPTLDLKQMSYFPFLSQLEEVVILKTRADKINASTAIAVPSSAFALPGIQALPDELLHLISEYAAAEKETQETEFGLSKLPALFQETQTLGSFDKEWLLLHPEETLHEALKQVQGDIKRLDPLSLTRLNEIAPFLRHLNLSGIEMTGEHIYSLIKTLAEAHSADLYDTSITAITLPEASFTIKTLRRLGDCEFNLSNLKRLEIERVKSPNHATRAPLDAKEIQALIQSSRLFRKLEHFTCGTLGPVSPQKLKRD